MALVNPGLRIPPPNDSVQLSSRTLRRPRLASALWRVAHRRQEGIGPGAGPTRRKAQRKPFVVNRLPAARRCWRVCRPPGMGIAQA
jgi:hypothetical protein